MKDYSDIGLDSRLRKKGGIASNEREFVDANTFSANYQIPTGGLSYSQINVASRSYVAVVTTSKKQGTFDNIQDAINYVNSVGGGLILIKAGTYVPLTNLVLPNNIELIGEGATDTIIDFTNATFGTPAQAGIQAIGTSITVVGTIAINNGATSVTGTSTTFSDDSVIEDDNLFINGVPYAIASVGSNTALTLKKTFRGKNVSGQTTDIQRNVVNVGARSLTVINSAEQGIAFLRVINGVISRNTVTKCDGGINWQGYQGEIVNNNCFNNDTSADAFGIFLTGISNCFGNYVANNREHGISCGKGAVVTNNYILNNDVSGITVGPIDSDVSIVNNFIQGNDFRGISIAASVNRVSIVGNIILDSGEDAIKITGSDGNTTNRVMVTGNVTNGEVGDGIELTSFTANCVVTNNSFGGGVTDGGANTVANNV